MAARILSLGLAWGTLVFVLASGLGSGGGSVQLPPRFVARAMVCGSSAAVIVGGEHGDFLPGDSRLFNREAIAFLVSTGDRSPRRVALGSGVLVDASSPDGQTIYAVRRYWFPDKPEQGHLIRSTDFGRTWNPVETPSTNIIGVAFESSRSGYAWSSDEILRTIDGGASWSSVRPPWLISPGRPKPVVDRSGCLWATSGHGPAWDRAHNAIARVSPDLRITNELVAEDFRVWELDVSEAGEAWMLTGETQEASLQLLRLAPGKGRAGLELVAELPSGLPKYLRVFGNEIVIALSEIGVSTPERFLLLSRDSGKSWTRSLPLDSSVGTFCALSGDQLWMVASSGGVYPPSAKDE